MPTHSTGKLRILCLHGYHGSAAVLRRQLLPFTESVADIAELVCIDAPSLDARDYGWWHATASDPSSEGTRLRYVGWERTRAAVLTTFERLGPFDGVLGFSQGATLTGLLVGLRVPEQELGGARPLGFEFAIMVGGFVSNDALLARLYLRREAYALPSLHVLGRADVVIPPEASRELAECFTRPTVLEHAGGHVIPSEPQVRQAFRAFLAQRLRTRPLATSAAESLVPTWK